MINKCSINEAHGKITTKCVVYGPKMYNYFVDNGAESSDKF